MISITLEHQLGQSTPIHSVKQPIPPQPPKSASTCVYTARTKQFRSCPLRLRNVPQKLLSPARREAWGRFWGVNSRLARGVLLAFAMECDRCLCNPRGIYAVQMLMHMLTTFLWTEELGHLSWNKVKISLFSLFFSDLWRRTDVTLYNWDIVHTYPINSIMKPWIIITTHIQSVVMSHRYRASSSSTFRIEQDICCYKPKQS